MNRTALSAAAWTVLALLGANLGTANAQRTSKEKVSFDVVRPPLKPVAAGTSADVRVELGYKPKVDAVIAANDAAFQRAMDEYPSIEAAAKAAYDQRYAQYQKELEAWNGKSLAGKIIEKQLLENQKPLPPAPYYPPSKPVKQPVVHETLFDESSLAATYGQITGLKKGAGGLQVELTLLGFEHSDPKAVVKNVSTYNSSTKQSVTIQKAQWEFGYRHPVRVLVREANGSVLWDETPASVTEFTPHSTDLIPGAQPPYPVEFYLPPLETKAMQASMTQIQKELNSHLGTVPMTLELPVYGVTGGKLDYTDLNTAQLKAMEGYRLLKADPTRATNNLKEAGAAWESALGEFNPLDKKARIQPNLVADLTTNAAYALAYAQEWDRAQAVLNRAAGWDLSKKEREDLKEAADFLADWKARFVRP
jgi:hypothetical protein